jgi:hypothetical protein
MAHLAISCRHNNLGSMPVEQTPLSKRLRLLVSIPYLMLGCGLLYLEIRRAVGPLLRMILPLAYLAGVSLLIRVGVIVVPESYRGPVFELRRLAVNALAALGCLLAAIAWTFVAVPRVDTNSIFGAIVIFGPSLICIGVGTYFVLRIFFRPTRER